ncbi:hypothetical protein BKK54_01780 [Rodentibacter genomosp. 1]|uniref:Type I restriction modification DNA specificity domain-containing protein n=1 Tax=Rodentibacter genomosp. 1 TaxID=1908264 RepID=A0A1V3J9H4_9PAST|nr:restriction endonuclease subunit S [Rodentibacter genomosp. 1]OOF51732.1 hypothetical protein BKK54_01780 [Rodentibacter genomosp. 1]
MSNKLSDIVDFNPPRALKRGKIAPFIEMASLPTNAKFIEQIDTKTFSGGSKFKNGDTLFARITPCLENGKTGKVTGLDDGSIGHGSTEFIVMSAKDPDFDEDYIYYFARLSEFREFAQQRMVGTSGRQRVAWQDLAEFTFKFPPKEERKRAAELLNVFDKKIQFNTQINQTLEQIAQGIFKSWFVDFDPVRAKAEVLAQGKTQAEAELAAQQIISGKTPEELTALSQTHPDRYAELAEIAKAFPSEFEEVDGFGEVPRGWEKVSISDKKICEIIKPKINQFEGEKDYIATANVSRNSIVGTLEKITYQNRPSRANMQPIINSIWFAKMVGEHKAILIDKNDEFLLKNTVLSTGFLGLKPQEKTKSFLYCFINSDYFTLSKNQLATGAVQIALNNTSFSKIELVLPCNNLLKFFEGKVSNLYAKISQNQRENRELSETRDFLLPRLLNGTL